MSKQRLDSVRNIEIDTLRPPISNYHALRYLRTGLCFLAYSVRIEEVRLSKNTRPGMTIVFSSGISPQIPCFFNWYSISLVSYLRLIGLVDVMNKKGWSTKDIKESQNRKAIREYCTTYTNEVASEIYQWRNKIAAHFAITDPLAEDNLGTLEYSIMNPISYANPYFEAGGFTWTVGDEKSELPKWALTRKHEELRERLWPDFQLPKV